jgi:hypothetical protein
MVSVQTFPTTSQGGGACLDSDGNIWLCRGAGNPETITLQKIDPATGAQLATYTFDLAGENEDTPGYIIFDNGSLWMTPGGNLLLKIDPSDGTLIISYPVITSITATNIFTKGLCSDGAGNIWVAVQYTDGSNIGSAVKLAQSNGAISQLVNVGTHAQGICFDGANVWITTVFDGTVVKILSSDGTILDTIVLGVAFTAVVIDILFDGASIWAVDSGQENLVKIDPVSDVVLDTIALNAFPFSVGYDTISGIYVMCTADFTAYFVPIFDKTSDVLLQSVDLSATINAGGQAWVFTSNAMWTEAENLDFDPIILRLLLSDAPVIPNTPLRINPDGLPRIPMPWKQCHDKCQIFT